MPYEGVVQDVAPEWDLAFVRPLRLEDGSPPLAYPIPLHRITRELALMPEKGHAVELQLGERRNLVAVSFGDQSLGELAYRTTPEGRSSPRENVTLDPQTAGSADNIEIAPPDFKRSPELEAWLKNGNGPKYLPDFSQWLPGDLILFDPIRPDNLEKLLQDGQKKYANMLGYDVRHASCVHAAIYTGNYGICEATIEHNVRAASIFSRLKKFRITLRRVRGIQGCDGHRLGIAALRAIRTRYALAKLARMWLTSQGGKQIVAESLTRRVKAGRLQLHEMTDTRPEIELLNEQKLTCADLFIKAYHSAIPSNPVPNGKNWLFRGAAEHCPAVLSAEDEVLEDVGNLRWVRVDASQINTR